MTTQITNPLIRTKVIATLGPSIANESILEEVIKQGLVNVFRLNFSHDTLEFHGNNIKNVRALQKKYNRPSIGILADLQGPKIRIKRFTNEKIMLKNGAVFTLDMKQGDDGDEKSVGVDYPAIINDCSIGSILLLDDGNIRLRVTEISTSTMKTIVEHGGKLSNNKGINLLGGGLSAPAITEKDKDIIRFASKSDVDFLAVSFVRRAEDLELVRSIAQQHDGFSPKIIAKIERAEIFKDGANTKTLDAIIEASDGVMVARGDLAVEVGVSEMVGLQKLIIERTIKLNRFVITATQMMESMISSPIPTRAEISDVGNAVFDGTDAIMFSGETAIGDYVLQTLDNARDICLGSAKHIKRIKNYHEGLLHFGSTRDMMASSSVLSSNQLENVGAIVCITQDGKTVNNLSRQVSHVPVIAVTPNLKTARFLSVLANVFPYYIPGFNDFYQFGEEHFTALIESLVNSEIIKPSEKIVLTYSLFKAPHNYRTNAMAILSASEILGGALKG